MRFLPKLGNKALPIYFLCGIAVIGIATFIYSNRFVLQISEETEKTSKLYAQFIKNPTLSNEQISDFIFREVILKIKFPVVLTDTTGQPISWRNIGDQIDSTEIYQIIKNLDRDNPPIAIKVITEGDSLVVGYVHYGMLPYVRMLKYLPFILTGFLSIFLLIGFWGFLQHRKSIEEKIWASMAKETAHQLATPTSSIIGWIEMLKGKIEDKYLETMEEDIGRIKDVLEKFSRIGMEPNLVLEDPAKILSPTINYMKKRAHKGVTIEEDYKPTARIQADPVLMRWAIENLIKNSLDAIGVRKGKIKVEIGEDNENVKISVIDNGGGIRGGRRIFEPGFSTKKYGWGLGLVLARRIIEEYHQGRLLLVTSKMNETQFSIIIPKGE